MGRVLSIGWELASLTEISATGGTTPTIVNGAGIPRSGTYALRTTGAGAASWVRYHYATTDQSVIGHLSVACKVESLPTAQARIVRFSNTANDPMAEVRQETSGLLTLWDSNGAQVTSIGGTTAAATITADGNYHVIEVKCDATTNPGAISLWVDNTLIATSANFDRGAWGRVLWGSIAANTQSHLWDDIKLNDGSGSTQTGRAGFGKLIYLRPNGPGDNNAWSDTANAAGTTNNYTLVNETSPDGPTTYVRTSTATTKDYYNLTDSGINSSDVVNVVQVGLQLANLTLADATAAVKAGIKKASGGTITQGTAIVPNITTFGINTGAEPRNYQLTTYTDPTGSPWTQATLDTAQAGIEMTTANVNPIAVSNLWVVVDYTPAILISGSDTATAVDATSLSTSRTVTETATATDLHVLTAALPGSEAATAVEGTASVGVVGAPVSEAPTAADTAFVTVFLSSSDSATAIDSQTLSTNSNPINSADVATGVDAATISATQIVNDDAFAADAISARTISEIPDVVIGTDAGSVRAEVSVDDPATGVDSAVVTAFLFTTDTATVADVGQVTASLSQGDSAAGLDTNTPTNVSVAVSDPFTVVDSITALGATVFAEDAAAGLDFGLIALTVADTAHGAEGIEISREVIVGDTALAVEIASAVVVKIASDTATAVETQALFAALHLNDTIHAWEGFDLFVKPRRQHRVMPYYVREKQDWAIEQERRRHNQALWYVGENTMFVLMWHLDDFKDHLVNRCPTCYESQGMITEVYAQSDEYKCQDCFGTTFEGGFKAIIVRPAIFSDTDEGETKHSRGVVHPNDLSIDSTPDFRVRTGDYCFRQNGDRFFLRVPERITLRTGFGDPSQTGTAIAYNHANAAVEDASNVSYIIPPSEAEVSGILSRSSRIPRSWSSYEIIRAPLIPGGDFAPVLSWGGSSSGGGDNVPGPQGPPGPPGPSGGSFVFYQASASMVWSITHSLAYHPAGVVVVDSAGTVVEGVVSYPSDNQVRIDFAVPFSGIAYLS